MVYPFKVNPITGKLDMVTNPAEMIRHVDLLDMPDPTGVNTDHDTRYALQGTFAAMPLPGVPGRRYWCTDILVMLRDTGGAWIEMVRGETVSRLNSLAEKSHASLTNVLPDQHHARSHVITAVGDHISGATPGKILKANANGLPIDATNTDADVADAVTKRHSQNTDTDLDAIFEATFVKHAELTEQGDIPYAPATPVVGWSPLAHADTHDILTSGGHGANPSWQHGTPRTATITIAASNASTESKRYADYVCTGVQATGGDAATINTAIAVIGALAAGTGSIHFTEGTFWLEVPVEWNVAAIKVTTSSGNPLMSGAAFGTRFKAADNFAGSYLMRAKSNGGVYDNLHLDCALKCNIGLQVEDSSFCTFLGLYIQYPLQKGLYLYALAGYCGSNLFPDVTIYMGSTTSSDARGIVLWGNDVAQCTTCCYFGFVTIRIKGVATSYGVDFNQHCDNNLIQNLQIGQIDSDLTAGVIFNSADPGDFNYVFSNYIWHLVYEPTIATSAQVISNVCSATGYAGKQPNIIDVAEYAGGSITQGNIDLIVAHWAGTSYPGYVLSSSSLISNADFERGTFDQLTGWEVYGSGATLTRDSSKAKDGVYSAKLTRAGTNCHLYQTILNGYAYRGMTLTLSKWVWASQANQACIALWNDGTPTDVVASSYHPGDSSWHLLRVTKIISPDATYVQVWGDVNDYDGSAYFDNASLVPVYLLDDTAAGTNGDVTQAPTSNAFYDHNATSLSSTIHPNTSLAKAYLNANITATPTSTWFRVELNAEDFDLGNNFSMAAWVTGTCDADSGAGVIKDAASTFTTAMIYAKVVWHDGHAYVTSVYSSHIILLCTTIGTDIDPGDTFTINHCEYTVPTTGYYLLSGQVAFTIPVVAQRYGCTIYRYNSGAWTWQAACYGSPSLLTSTHYFPCSTTPAYLVAGDLIILVAYQSSGGTTAVIAGSTSGYTNLSIALLQGA
jgi:hypothetical protein